MPHVERVAVYRGREPLPLESRWTLSRVTSNTRYVERPEQRELTLKHAPLSRAEATREVCDGPTYCGARRCVSQALNDLRLAN